MHMFSKYCSDAFNTIPESVFQANMCNLKRKGLKPVRATPPPPNKIVPKAQQRAN